MSRPLAVAFGLSALLHALPFAAGLFAGRSPLPQPPSTPLQARLTPPPAPAPQAELLQPEPPAKAKATAAVPEKPANSTVDRKKTAKTWTQAIREQFAEQQRDGLFYPEAAIRQGLEGEVLVLLLLDAEGNVAAARVEAGSGHALLDEAALRAVRRLRTLPAGAPSETLLPVRFRLQR